MVIGCLQQSGEDWSTKFSQKSDYCGINLIVLHATMAVTIKFGQVHYAHSSGYF